MRPSKADMHLLLRDLRIFFIDRKFPFRFGIKVRHPGVYFLEEQEMELSSLGETKKLV